MTSSFKASTSAVSGPLAPRCCFRKLTELRLHSEIYLFIHFHGVFCCTQEYFNFTTVGIIMVGGKPDRGQGKVTTILKLLIETSMVEILLHPLLTQLYSCMLLLCDTTFNLQHEVIHVNVHVIHSRTQCLSWKDCSARHETGKYIQMFVIWHCRLCRCLKVL